jgi:protein-disulfide isomerase
VRSCNPIRRPCGSCIVTRPFHPWACEYAKIAYCAGTLGKFWEANDYLFDQGRRGSPVTAEELAVALDLDEKRVAACVASDATRRHVEEDLAAGRAADVRGTPTFVLDGKAYPGRIPDEILRAALARAGHSVEGVAADP